MKKKFNLRNFIDEQYKISFSYIKGSKNFIYSTIGIFFVFSLVGFFLPIPESIATQIINYFKELVSKTAGLSLPEMILFLFNNNSISGFMGLFFGAVFGIFPVLSSIANGFVLGFVSNTSVHQDGIFSLWRLFPHGIFELPAIFISFGLGIKLSTFILVKDKWKTFQKFFINSLSVYIFVILPLLVIAAIIEGTLIYLGA